MRHARLLAASLVVVAACAHVEPTPPTPPTPPTRPTRPTSASSSEVVATTPSAAPSSSANVAPAPVPPPPDVPRPPDPLEPLRDALTLAVGDIATVWTIGSKTFVLAARAHPAVQRAADLAYPPRAQEAALGGRLVEFTEIWTWQGGQLARVLARPTMLRPMVCETDEDCTIAEVRGAVNATGDLVVEPGSCGDALASVEAQKDSNTFTVFDGAVIPSMCRAVGTHRWNGTTFALAKTKTAPPDGVTIHTPGASLHAVASAMFPGAIQTRIDASWRGPTDDERLVALRVTYPAPAHAYFAHEPAARLWESGRAIDVTEVWLARDGSFRRLLQVPTGLGSLAEARSVLTMSVEGKGAELIVCGDPRDGVRTSRVVPDSAPSSVEADLQRRDDEAARRILAGCGAYRFDGRGLVKQATPRGLSSF